MRTLILFAAAIAALTFSATAATASASSWRLAESDSDTSSWFTSNWLSSFDDSYYGKLVVKTSRRMKVKVKVNASCHDYDYTRSIRRERTPFYIWVSPSTPFKKVLYPTFSGADGCSYSVFVDGSRGRLTSWLYVQG